MGISHDVYAYIAAGRIDPLEAELQETILIEYFRA